VRTDVPTVVPQFLRSRIGKICVAIIGNTPAEMLEKATTVLKENPFLEFRRAANNGKFAGNVAAELEILTKAAEAGFQIADLELESAEHLKKAELQALRDTGVALIVSYHDFHATKDLEAIYDRIQPFKPDFIKIVSTAKHLADNVTLMRFLEKMEDHTNIIAICMGDAGIISRVLGVRAGSAFTFAAATAGEETGPGQIAARTLIETYRIDQVDAATKVYGVAGNPIRSSLSPIMMNTAFRRETVNAVYLALQATKIGDLLKLVHEIPIQGLSVTMPLKQEIMEHLEHTDPLSAKIGAVNTVLRQEGKLYGFNTDVAGIVGPIEKRLSLRGAKVLVLGAGGAARAAVFGCRDKGAEVFILNRTPETAQKLARQSGAKTIKKEAVAKTAWDVIINATPVGMSGQKGAPILEAKDLNTKLVFDLVYNPLETPLLRMARQQNIPIITGIEMFVQQGARQFEIFTGKPAPEEEMLRVVIHSLRQQAEAEAPHALPPAAKTPETPAAPAAAKPAVAAKAAPKPVAKVVAKAPAKPAPRPVAKPKPPAKAPAKKAAAKAKSR
jgi:3-dehydroquinate dehydratase/shikimate dehydrogenase